MREHPLDHRSKRQARKWFDPRVALLLSTKTSAAARGLENTLCKEDIVIPETCPVLGVTLQAGGLKPNSMTVDRIDNELGYTPDNISVISWRANMLKKNGTLYEFQCLVNYLEKGLRK